MLESLCRAGRGEGKAAESLEEIRRYIERIGMSYLGVPGDADSGNPLLDAIIGTKKNYAAAKGIDIRAKLQIPEGMKPDGVDTVILLGNLLDNAIEASERTPEGVVPEIEAEIRYHLGALCMTIRNTYDGRLDGRSSKDGELLKTDKPDQGQHGIGMANILRVVEKYDGYMEWNAEEGIFTVIIMLYGFDRDGWRFERT